MTEKEKRILQTFAEIIPKLSESKKEGLLGFGEGLAFAINRQNNEPAAKTA